MQIQILRCQIKVGLLQVARHDEHLLGHNSGLGAAPAALSKREEENNDGPVSSR